MSDARLAPVDFPGGVVVRGGQRRPATLHVAVEGLEAVVEGEARHRVAWNAVRLERGGSSGSTIFVHAPRIVVDCDDPGFLRAVEGTGGNDVADALARLEGQKVATRTRHTLGWLVVLVLLGLAVWGVPRLFRAGVNGVVASLPYAVDERIGEVVSQSMDHGGKLVEDELVVGAVQAILDRLAPHTSLPDLELHLTIIESEVVNAFALPGGYLTVFTGLLREAEGPDQVAGVLAHEIAHVTQRHGLRRVAHSLGLWVGLQLLLGDTSGLTGVAKDVFNLASVNSYSREQESEADHTAVRLLVAARLDPLALAEFFRRLEREQPGPPPALSWMSTHPEHGTRTVAIEELVLALRPLPEPLPLDIDWEAVLRHLE